MCWNTVYCSNTSINRQLPETHKFLKQFYLDLEEMKNDPISDGECIFKMANHGVNFCDAPVRSTMKCIISHTGYHSCERCTVKGQFDEHARHVRFLDVDCCLCIDLDFVQQTDKDQHTGFSFLVAK